MENPATGLPVLAMPSTIFLRPASLNANHDYGGNVWIAAGADHGAEEQFEVLAELQAAIGVGNRKRALDVVRHGFARGIGDVVNRQNDHVIAHCNAAVFAPVSKDFPLCHGYAHLFVLRLCM